MTRAQELFGTKSAGDDARLLSIAEQRKILRDRQAKALARAARVAAHCAQLRASFPHRPE